MTSAFVYTDASGRTWEIVDYRRSSFGARAKRVPLGDMNSDGRAFIPHGWEGKTMLCEFGRVAYRETDERTLGNQLAMAKPVGATPTQRMDR